MLLSPFSCTFESVQGQQAEFKLKVLNRLSRKVSWSMHSTISLWWKWLVRCRLTMGTHKLVDACNFFFGLYRPIDFFSSEYCEQTYYVDKRNTLGWSYWTSCQGIIGIFDSKAVIAPRGLIQVYLEHVLCCTQYHLFCYILPKKKIKLNQILCAFALRVHPLCNLCAHRLHRGSEDEGTN